MSRGINKVIANEMQMLGGRSDGQQRSQPSRQSSNDYAQASRGGPSADDFGDDVPF